MSEFIKKIIKLWKMFVLKFFPKHHKHEYLYKFSQKHGKARYRKCSVCLYEEERQSGRWRCLASGIYTSKKGRFFNDQELVFETAGKKRKSQTSYFFGTPRTNSLR